jgi:hypothetical protein
MAKSLVFTALLLFAPVSIVVDVKFLRGADQDIVIPGVQPANTDWGTSFELWPAQEELLDGRIFLRLKDGTRILADTGAGFGQNSRMKAVPAETEDAILASVRSRFQAAMVLAVAADALQILVLPLFAEGAFSPADDVLDLAVAAVLVRLLGWHWEFLPAFAGELVPGVDLVPFWTLALANVYRKWKRITVAAEEAREQRPALPKPQDLP